MESPFSSGSEIGNIPVAIIALLIQSIQNGKMRLFSKSGLAADFMNVCADGWGNNIREVKESPIAKTNVFGYHFICSIATHMLKKIGSKWVVLSETTGRRMGSYKTKKEAQKRLRQIEFFKHLKGSPSLKRKLKKKSLLK